MGELTDFLYAAFFIFAAYGVLSAAYDLWVYSSSTRMRTLAMRLLDAADQRDDL